jgi:hypothetical protein
MAQLYEIVGEFLSIYNGMMDGDEEPNEEVMKRLDENTTKFANKVESCVRMVKNLQADQMGIEEERKRLQARERAIKNNVECLKKYVMDSMTDMGTLKLDTGVFRVAVQKNPKSVSVLDIEKIPSMYDVAQERKVSLTQIKDDLLSGTDVPGTELKQTVSLRIR